MKLERMHQEKSLMENVPSSDMKNNNRLNSTALKIFDLSKLMIIGIDKRMYAMYALWSSIH